MNPAEIAMHIVISLWEKNAPATPPSKMNDTLRERAAVLGECYKIIYHEVIAAQMTGS
jgi:hypothetical protein